MTIKVGDQLPDVAVKRIGPDGITDVSTASLFAGRNVILFGVPGAFTPTCSEVHLPGYLALADELQAQGVDEIICVAVNDHHVMRAWGRSIDTDGVLTLLADGNAAFVRALGLDIDLSVAGMGVRSKRFSMTVNDGAVTDLQVEAVPSQVELSGAESCLVRIKAHGA